MEVEVKFLNKLYKNKNNDDILIVINCETNKGFNDISFILLTFFIY